MLFAMLRHQNPTRFQNTGFRKLKHRLFQNRTIVGRPDKNNIEARCFAIQQVQCPKRIHPINFSAIRKTGQFQILPDKGNRRTIQLNENGDPRPARKGFNAYRPASREKIEKIAVSRFLSQDIKKRPARQIS
jgi:hypothetical protein